MAKESGPHRRDVMRLAICRPFLFPCFIRAHSWHAANSMPDHFAALDQPRRPWIDPEALKDFFHRASAELHPDVAGSGDAARFAEVNAAYSALRDPVWRLRHLLELEAPEQLSRPQSIPAEFADLFMRAAGFRQALDALMKKDGAAPNALTKALLANERMALWQRVTALRDEIDAAYEASVALLCALDAEWEARPPDIMERLAGLQQRFAYLSRWRVQVGESLFKLQP
jgi:DnaJ-domain-containing protein 1